jgi:plasmid stabilization system protein ParE
VRGRYRIQILDRARREIAVDIAWWRLHRSSDPRALRDEIARGCDLLSRNPEAGPAAEDYPGVRRLLLLRVSYHLYYRVNHAARQIEIVALWHTRRRPPVL